MLIVGARGFAKEVLEILTQLNNIDTVSFFDNISENLPNYLYDKFKILKTEDEVVYYFKNISPQFTIGVGLPTNRYNLCNYFESLGGKFSSTISPNAHIGHYNNFIGEGVNLMTGSVITNDIVINKGCLINLNCTIGHDSTIGNFVELSPGVHISGNCNIGDFSYFGTNSTVLPKLNIGKNVTVGAGAVITHDIPDDSVVIGIPGKIIKTNPPIKL